MISKSLIKKYVSEIGKDIFVTIMSLIMSLIISETCFLLFFLEELNYQNVIYFIKMFLCNFWAFFYRQTKCRHGLSVNIGTNGRGESRARFLTRSKNTLK